MLYDDDYTGPRFTYGLNYRPLGYAQVPEGYILFSDKENKDYKFGTVDYPKPLTDTQVNSYQLTPVL